MHPRDRKQKHKHPRLAQRLRKLAPHLDAHVTWQFHPQPFRQPDAHIHQPEPEALGEDVEFFGVGGFVYFHAGSLAQPQTPPD